MQCNAEHPKFKPGQEFAANGVHNLMKGLPTLIVHNRHHSLPIYGRLDGVIFIRCWWQAGRSSCMLPCCSNASVICL
jgi:hypothetical protein